VLSGLEPPSQIESLVICRYQGPCLPRWLMEQNGSYSEGTTLKQTGPCQYLKLLPDAIQHLTSLENLELICCRALVELPEGIGQLSALRRLHIYFCSALQCLPQSIQHLTALQNLYIYNCPALASRYKQGVGPDWHLVSHIPRVWIYPWRIRRLAA